MRAFLGGLLLAIAAAGCGSTTIRVVTDVRTVTVAPQLAVVPLKIPALTDNAGTYISWTGPGAGVAAAEFQRNSAQRFGSFWTMTEQAGNSQQAVTCQLAAGGLHVLVSLEFNSGDGSTADSICADFLKVGFHQTQ